MNKLLSLILGAVIIVAVIWLMMPKEMAQAEKMSFHAPDENSILTVEGVDDYEGEVGLSAAELATMPQTEITTSNDFVEEATTFTGPLMRDLVARFHPGADEVMMSAADGYTIEIDTAEFDKYDAILATHANGQPLDDAMGPMWVIYPMSDHAELQTEEYNSRLIWQVTKMAFDD